MKPGKTRRKAIEGKRRRYDRVNHRQNPPADRQRGKEVRDEQRRMKENAGPMIMETNVKSPPRTTSVAGGRGGVIVNVGNCSFTAIRTTSNTTSTPGARTRSLPVTADTSTRNSRLKSQKDVPVQTPKLCNFVYPSPVSTRWKWVVKRRSRRVKASDPVAPPVSARDTCAKKPSIRVVVLAVVGLSGVIAHVNAFLRGRSQPGTHVGDRMPSVQRSSQRMRVSGMADFIERLSCCAPSALFRDARNGRTEIARHIFIAYRDVSAADGGDMRGLGGGIGGIYRGGSSAG